MRGFFGMVALVALAGCGGASADVTGSAGGVDFGSTTQVYFGGPFIIISMLEVDCQELDFVKRNYETGQSPTEASTSMLQFSYMDADEIVTGPAPVALTSSVSASVVKITDAFAEAIADGGLLTVDEVDPENTASGSFEGLAFEDGGTLNGTFDATWCRNLKAR